VGFLLVERVTRPSFEGWQRLPAESIPVTAEAFSASTRPEVCVPRLKTIVVAVPGRVCAG